MTEKQRIKELIAENERRQKQNNIPFNPVTGQGSVGRRRQFYLPDFPIPTQHLPLAMHREPLVKALAKAGSVAAFIRQLGPEADPASAAATVVREFCRLRNRHDFPFWAATLAYIKRKGGGPDTLLRLNRPQRRLVDTLEQLRLQRKPIRLILLKARQWGGSTCIQLYMAWLQLCHRQGLNSLIIGHVGKSSYEIKDMFDRMLNNYPVEFLHNLGESYSPSEEKKKNVDKAGDIFRIPQRNCKVKIGTAEEPDSCRGGDYNLVHLSEVGLWKATPKKTPESIVRSACAGIPYAPGTMIVYESTANGTDNFFHTEYLAAKNGTSQFRHLFVPWHEIEIYSIPFETADGKADLAKNLLLHRTDQQADSPRQEPGAYLWKLWSAGATLENIHWYILERQKFNSHSEMAAEYPTDDIEAFTFSGRNVFPDADIEQLRPACRPPKFTGEIYGADDQGPLALEGIRLTPDPNGQLSIWHHPEKDTPEATVADRYIVAVDVCKGHTKNADFADILVLDRLPVIDNEPPVVAAEWHGHIDMDRLAWKSAQIATLYNNALLVIESNTLETNNTKGEAEYILQLVGDAYPNLYMRKQSAEDIQMQRPRKYGFHTNTLTKKVVILNLKVALREHLYIEREEKVLLEYHTYIETDSGAFEAQKGHHDDRLMTRAIALQISTHEMEPPRIINFAQLNRQSSRIINEATI